MKNLLSLYIKIDSVGPDMVPNCLQWLSADNKVATIFHLIELRFTELIRTQ